MLTHEEHDTWVVEPGAYEEVVQVEEHRKRIQRVVD